MRRRVVARFVLALAWVAWSSVIMPGHTRGEYVVPGASNDAPSCCLARAGDHSDSKPDRHTPTNRQRACCAVCYIVAGLSIPPAIISFSKTSVLALDPPVIEPVVPARVAEVPSPISGRAPPPPLG